MHLVVFEGTHWPAFAPLSLSRPVFMLATGASALLARQIRQARPSRLTLWVRPELAQFCEQRIVPELKLPVAVNRPLDDEPALLVDASSLSVCADRLPTQQGVVLGEQGVPLQACIRRPGLGPEDVLRGSDTWASIARLPTMPMQIRAARRLWDLLQYNEQALAEDFAHIPRPSAARPPGPYHIIEPQQVWLGQGVVIEPGVVLDAAHGPILLDDGARIGANSVLQGPCYIGPQTQVLPQSLIRAGASIGPLCKVRGEISSSIILGYSNKAHDGFLGDSYLGQWVNLGAGTTTSNLKNTYGQITIAMPAGPLPTGRRFLGSLIGDHAKTAIGTRLMAGTYMGFSSMLACSAIAPKFIPSFAFVTDKGSEPYRVDKAIEVMKAVFARRGRQVDAIDEQIAAYLAAAAPKVEGTQA